MLDIILICAATAIVIATITWFIRKQHEEEIVAQATQRCVICGAPPAESGALCVECHANHVSF